MLVAQKVMALANQFKGKLSRYISSDKDCKANDPLHIAKNESNIKYLDYCSRHPQAFIEISSKCNFRCFYCRSVASKRKHIMSENLFYHVADQLHEVTDQPVRLHMDGEPLLHKKFEEFARALNSRGHAVALASNGSLLKARYVDINMSVLVNLSTSKEELAKRSKMNFNAYVETLANYILAWKTNESGQHITYGVYTSKEERSSPESMCNKYAFIDSFLAKIGLKRGPEPVCENKNTIFSYANTGGGVFKIAFFNIASGGLYPETEAREFRTTLPKTVGFCDSPWKRFVILADGRAAFCCLDVMGTLAYTNPGEVWNMPLKSIFMEHKNIIAVRKKFLDAKVSCSTCRLCLDRTPARVFRAGFQVTYESFEESLNNQKK
jgi:organic radical activating enzyme